MNIPIIFTHQLVQAYQNRDNEGDRWIERAVSVVVDNLNEITHYHDVVSDTIVDDLYRILESINEQEEDAEVRRLQN